MIAYTKPAVALSIALLGLAGPATAADEPMLRALEDCAGQEACLHFDLHHPEQDGSLVIGKGRSAVTGERPLNEDWTEYEVTLTGRLAAGKPERYRLTFRSFTSGIQCSAFGQAKIPVLGYSAAGGPIVLTGRGEFEIIDAGDLALGCTGCMRLLGRTAPAIVRAYNAPSWDLALVGLSRGDVRFNDDGEIFVESEGRCVRLADSQRFRLVPVKQCRTPEPAMLSYLEAPNGVDMEAGDFMLKVEGARYRLLLIGGACT